MNSADGLRTLFASPERASELEICSSAKLFENLDLLRTALDAVPDPVLILNLQRQAVYINDIARQSFNLQDWKDALGERPGELLNCQHAHEMPAGCGTSESCSTCGALKAILAGIRGQSVAEECRISLSSGESLDFKVWARPLYLESETGVEQYVICSVQDISDEKRRRALERIFFHDVLNTAGILSTYTQLLGMSQEDSEMIIKELHHASERLIEEIQMQQQLLAAESHELNPKPVFVDVQALLSELGAQYQRRAQKHGRQFHLVHLPINVSMMTDPVLLRRVVSNMLKNALEATQEGETVTLSYEVDNHRITFAVHNPTVMPRHVQLQIFKRSFSTKGEGRGLGTYSMKFLSERYLKGSVWFRSNKQLGTIFYAAYPLNWYSGDL